MLTYSPLENATNDELRHLSTLLDQLLESRRKALVAGQPIADDACFYPLGSIADEVIAGLRNRSIGKCGFCLVMPVTDGDVTYLTESGSWEQASPLAATRPRCYCSKGQALRGKDHQVRKDDFYAECQIAVWVHPEADWPERSKYLSMERRLPSSPTQ